MTTERTLMLVGILFPAASGVLLGAVVGAFLKKPLAGALVGGGVGAVGAVGVVTVIALQAKERALEQVPAHQGLPSARGVR